MHDDIVLVQPPSLDQLQRAADWLVMHPHKNPSLEVDLAWFLHHRIVPQEAGGLGAIAYSSSAGALQDDGLQDIRGIVIAQPDNMSVSLEGSDRHTVELLFALVQPRGCIQRAVISSQGKDWLRPLLLQYYQLEREENPLVMLCTQRPNHQSPSYSGGRWALPQDKPALQAYAEAYRMERGSGSLNQNWDALIQRKQVAVLDYEGHIVSVVKRGSTMHHAIVFGIFTFPPFRNQGFARRLLAFLIQEMLQEYPAVKLWVDEDNSGAITLYRSLGFQQIGSCYTGRFSKQ